MIFRRDSLPNLLKAVLRTIGFLLRGRPVVAPAKIRLERMAACEACPHNVADQCVLCTCFVVPKTYLSAEECPARPPKWKKLTFSRPQPKEPPIA